ncbi:hypothetical protein [Winogradskyella sp. PG-2]|uniref:hypothetical protein n=1 Tax=Winogradskyella sp. PG-2 TaxID=754409 RepID=UPI001E463051|nr:hypothetical protein [Winogradskyella sp. PG-2]
MNTSLKIQKSLIIFVIPLLLIAVMVVLTNSSLFTANSNQLSLAITIELLLTTPFIYFLLIRKTTIPKTTVVPFIIIGVVICSFILPKENLYYLYLFKTWVLPLIELSVLSFIIYKMVKPRRLYKHNQQNTTSDFFTILKTTCY